MPKLGRFNQRKWRNMARYPENLGLSEAWSHRTSTSCAYLVKPVSPTVVLSHSKPNKIRSAAEDYFAL